ncbi:MAG TPA: xanthine dehydrogenase family protein molybdopterin-binding subunit [Beijerinckiaceae bacterium]|nr:xanthine dehydrogenase family protein molybdopterin-binding subunit [Beijerinckiaceae bacterium]
MSRIETVLLRAIGKPVRRKEDLRLVTGAGRFSDDFGETGQTYAAIIRSPHPHARIDGIDKVRARARPGVLGVFDGFDLAADGLDPIPHSPLPSTKYDMMLTAPDGTRNVFIGPHVLLPTDKARHVGEAVAMVVAETLAQALDAAEAVVIDYEPLPFVADAREAASAGAPAVWDEKPDNICVETWFGDRAATDRAFAAAAHVVKYTFHIDRVTGVPLEPRSALAVTDAATGRSTLYAGSGGAVRQKAEVAHVLHVPPGDLRILSFDVGGNFGTRNRLYVEFGLVLWASRKLGRPVKFTATRSEAFLSDYQGRDLVSDVALALDENGRFLALRADNLSNVGARAVSFSPLSKGSGLITGSYDIPAATLRARAVFTNTMPTQAYRSSGRPEVNFAIERLIDMAAEQLGFDRIDLRRRNFVAPEAMPYVNAVGAVYDSGTYETNMDQAMKLARWDEIDARRGDAKKRGKLYGVGLANYVESSIGSPRERAEIKVRPEGIIELVIGTQPSGQGHETSFAQVAADMLGVGVQEVKIVLGDTDIVSVGGGSHSGRSMRHAGTVIAMASDDLIEKGRRIGALHFGVPLERITFDDGRFAVSETNSTLGLFELARVAEAMALPDDLKGGLSVGRTNEMHDPVFPNGTAICEVEIDPETCEMNIVRYASVDDVGRCINPMIVHGQTHGGIVQGLGQAVFEQFKLDPDSGQPLCGSFMDYAMPRAADMPFFKSEIAEVLSPTNPLGIKAGGEGGTTPALSVLVSAVVDALKPYGVTHIDMPVTPFAIWRAIKGAAKHDAEGGRS